MLLALVENQNVMNEVLCIKVILPDVHAAYCQQNANTRVGCHGESVVKETRCCWYQTRG